MEASDLLHSALEDISRSIHILRLIDCLDLAADLEAYLIATITGYNPPPEWFTFHMTGLECHAASSLQRGEVDEVTWLRMNLVERDLLCARLRLQLASRFAGGKDQERMSEDVERLREVLGGPTDCWLDEWPEDYAARSSQLAPTLFPQLHDTPIMADLFPIFCFPQDMEANDVYLSALADIRRSAHFLRLADCPNMAAPLEAYLKTPIANHGLPASTDLMAWLPRHVACLLQQPRGMDELTWLRFKLAERELKCARLSLQMASQYTGREEGEIIAADTRRLSDTIRPFRPETPYERERDPQTLHPLWHKAHKTEAHR
ncbi:hypothetical protein LTR17_007605 [Elasticomyces elasticus]|nr:hypothetical protein LTR17_007605 [Elasticomyces elasticus]